MRTQRSVKSIPELEAIGCFDWKPNHINPKDLPAENDRIVVQTVCGEFIETTVHRCMFMGYTILFTDYSEELDLPWSDVVRWDFAKYN